MQALGRRHYRPRRHSPGSGAEPQCGAERTNEEDSLRGVQDVKLVDLRRASAALLASLFSDFLFL